MNTTRLPRMPLPDQVDVLDTWKPLLFPCGNSEARLALQELESSGRVIFRHNTFLDQIKELIETRAPGVSLNEAEADQRLQEQTACGMVPACGTWVYYPWSRRLVHVLPETEFRELRTSRNRNKITAEEQERLRLLKLAIVGLSVGMATAVTLAMEEVGGTFLLADFDCLSLSNMNRLRAGVHNIGVNKAILAAREIYELNPYANVRVFPEGLNDENIDAFLEGNGKIDLLLEECEDLFMKVRLRERCRSLGIPVLMETGDRGLLDVERFDREPQRPLFHGRTGSFHFDSFHNTVGMQTNVPPEKHIVGEDTISARLAESLVEIDVTFKTRPRLASAVSLSAAINTDAARRIALGSFKSSGRFYVDLEQLIFNQAAGTHPPAQD